MNNPLEDSNWYKNGLVVPIKKLSNHQLKSARSRQVEPSVDALVQRLNNPTKVMVEQKLEAVKTAYGRQVKPVLLPIKTENVRCDHCESLFNSIANLKHHVKKAHFELYPSEEQVKCQNKILPLDFVPAPPIAVKNFPFKCDICYRRFDKRSRMIRHIKNVHSSDIHRVDLSRFVLPSRKFQQLQPWSMVEL